MAGKRGQKTYHSRGFQKLEDRHGGKSYTTVIKVPLWDKISATL